MNIRDLKLYRSFVIFCILAMSLFFSCAKSTDTAPNTSSSLTPLESEPSGIVFVGDSNTAHLSTYALVSRDNILTGSEFYMSLEPDVCNALVVSSKLKKELTVADAICALNPEYAVICLGTDGALSLDDEGIELAFSELITSLKEKAPKTFICLVLMPFC